MSDETELSSAGGAAICAFVVKILHSPTHVRLLSTNTVVYFVGMTVMPLLAMLSAAA